MGRRTIKKTVTLEEYEHFLENPHDETLTLDQLNEVIFMHGFKKIHKRPKWDLYEALSTIDLIKPQRSTLKDEFSTHDFSFSVDEVKQDLEALQWQECAVQSVETIGKSESDGTSGVVSNDIPISSFKINRKRQRSKRQTKRMIMRNIAADDSVDQCNSAADADVDYCGANNDSGGAGTGAGQYDSSLSADTYCWEL